MPLLFLRSHRIMSKLFRPWRSKWSCSLGRALDRGVHRPPEKPHPTVGKEVGHRLPPTGDGGRIPSADGRKGCKNEGTERRPIRPGRRAPSPTIGLSCQCSVLRSGIESGSKPIATAVRSCIEKRDFSQKFNDGLGRRFGGLVRIRQSPAIFDVEDRSEATKSTNYHLQILETAGNGWCRSVGSARATNSPGGGGAPHPEIVNMLTVNDTVSSCRSEAT
jgi:hypothetical protein